MPMSVAVLLPCYNEEATISQVVQEFKKVLPEATVFVYDNNSTDNTSEAAIAAGAVVRIIVIDKNSGFFVITGK